ncbi:hypothetical protein [Actinomyces denticolens]|uniref:hypothetical protein n=1 Tax=Actinomyces denticolens TaxID=52767 RepID=UPI0027D8CC55|nr:hypothetical protein [Actinomyces denticolens]
MAALDITWGDLRAGSIIDRLDAAGRVRRLLDPSRIEAAADTRRRAPAPPCGAVRSPRSPSRLRLLDQSRHRCSPAPPAHPSRPAGRRRRHRGRDWDFSRRLGARPRWGRLGPVIARHSRPTRPNRRANAKERP